MNEYDSLDKVLPRYIRVGNGTTSDESVMKTLLSENSILRQVKWMPNFLSFPGCCSLSDIKWGCNNYKDLGCVFPMDVSSSLAIATLCLPSHGNNNQSECKLQVLDLCCSPGAKFQMLSELLNNNSLLVGVDISGPRLDVCKSLINKMYANSTTETIESLPRQLIFRCDGTTFNQQNFGILELDSNIIKNELVHCGKRKRVNKSAKLRERKQLKLVEQSLLLRSTAVLSAPATTAAVETTTTGNLINNRTMDTAEQEVGLAIRDKDQIVESINLGPFDYCIVDAECTHDASYRHMRFLPNKGTDDGNNIIGSNNDSSNSANIVHGNAAAAAVAAAAVAAAAVAAAAAADVMCVNGSDLTTGGGDKSTTQHNNKLTKPNAVLSHIDSSLLCGTNSNNANGNGTSTNSNNNNYHASGITSVALTTLQRGLLLNGFKLLKPGGTLVYSTCSQETAQNEAVVQWLLDTCSDARLVPVDLNVILSVSSGSSAVPGIPPTPSDGQSRGCDEDKDGNGTDQTTESSASILSPEEVLNMGTISDIVAYTATLSGSEQIQLACAIRDHVCDAPGPVFEEGGLKGTVRLNYKGAMSGHFIAKICKKLD